MKTILLFMLSIITVQSLVAQDTVILKTGKVVPGKIISLSNGIKLLIAKDTIKYAADKVASLMFCSSNKNCSYGDINSSGGSSSVTSKSTKDNSCNCMHKQDESAGRLKPKPLKSRNSKY